MAIVAAVEMSDVRSAEEYARVALSGWKSQYCYTLSPAPLAQQPPFHFAVEWSRRPSPHEPLPSIRVHMAAAVAADGRLTCRLEGEQAIHRCSTEAGGSMDAHILRLLKAKAELIKRSRLPLSASQAAFLQSRLAYHCYKPPALGGLDTHSDSLHKLTAALDRRAQPTASTTHATAASAATSAQQTHRAATTQRTARRRGWDEDELEDELATGQEEIIGDEERQPRDDGCELDGAAPAVAESVAATGVAPQHAASTSGSPNEVPSGSSEWQSPLTAPVPSSHAEAASAPSSSPAFTSSSSSVYSLPSAAALEGRLVELFRQADVDGRCALKPAYAHTRRTHSQLCTHWPLVIVCHQRPVECGRGERAALVSCCRAVSRLGVPPLVCRGADERVRREWRRAAGVGRVAASGR